MRGASLLLASTFLVTPALAADITVSDGDIQSAIDRAAPGDRILVPAGTYNTKVSIEKSGTGSAPITLQAVGGKATLNCSGSDTCISMHGADNWRIKGIGARGANGSEWNFGIYVSDSSNNVFSGVESSHNEGPGMLVHGDSRNNLVENSEFHDNADPQNGGGDADGLSIASAPSSATGNLVVNSKSYRNSDDGFDLWQMEAPVTLDGNEAYQNGAGGGDGNGFKLGKNESGPRHVLKGNRAHNNKARGFDDNEAHGTIEMTNNASFDNGGEAYSFETARMVGSGNVGSDPGPREEEPGPSGKPIEERVATRYEQYVKRQGEFDASKERLRKAGMDGSAAWDDLLAKEAEMQGRFDTFLHKHERWLPDGASVDDIKGPQCAEATEAEKKAFRAAAIADGSATEAEALAFDFSNDCREPPQPDTADEPCDIAIGDEQRDQYDDEIEAAARKYGHPDPGFLKAQVEWESHFDASEVSDDSPCGGSGPSSKSIGLFQVTPQCGEGGGRDMFDPSANIDEGVKAIAGAYKHFRQAIPGCTERQYIEMAAAGYVQDWDTVTGCGEYGDSRQDDYVANVNRYYRQWYGDGTGQCVAEKKKQDPALLASNDDAVAASTQDAVATATAQHSGESGSVVFQDDFDGPAGSKPGAPWHFFEAWKQDNSPKQWRDAIYSEDYAKLDGNGNLVITGEPCQGGKLCTSYLQTFDWLNPTTGDGWVGPGSKIEARIDMSDCGSTNSAGWCAFWTMHPKNAYDGNAANGSEIDIAEYSKGNAWTQSRYTVNAHVTNGRGGSDGTWVEGADPTSGFHTYGVEWHSDKLVYTFDGKPVFETTKGVSGTAQPLILSVENQKGVFAKEAQKTTPVKMVIDWVKTSKLGD